MGAGSASAEPGGGFGSGLVSGGGAAPRERVRPGVVVVGDEAVVEDLPLSDRLGLPRPGWSHFFRVCWSRSTTGGRPVRLGVLGVTARTAAFGGEDGVASCGAGVSSATPSWWCAVKIAGQVVKIALRSGSAGRWAS